MKKDSFERIRNISPESNRSDARLAMGAVALEGVGTVICTLVGVATGHIELATGVMGVGGALMVGTAVAAIKKH